MGKFSGFSGQHTRIDSKKSSGEKLVARDLVPLVDSGDIICYAFQ